MIDRLLAAGLLPDPVVRAGIRRLLRRRLAGEAEAAAREGAAARLARWADEMRAGPIAVHAEAAKKQHYEVPTEFFRLVLGHRLKYSSGYWPEGIAGLDAAEDAMLTLTAERAGLADGQRVLDLGCGWGSLALWLAERDRATHITAVSHSATQRAYIEGEAARRGLANVRVVTQDVSAFQPQGRFDRVVSVEMFEHLRNWEQMLGRIAGWLEPQGAVFLHVFAHRRWAYPFEDQGPSDWMARHFFTGGHMPSVDLLLQFQRDLEVSERWEVAGTHYARTAEAWLANMDRHRPAVQALFRQVYGSEACRFWNYWRAFFMACAELWGWAGGNEWLVAHARLRPRRAATP